MKLFVCMPVMVGNGSKYIATNLAHYTKKLYPDKKVALVDFDFINPYLAEKLSLHDNIHGIDNLTDKIDGNFLDNHLFTENMVKLKNGVELLKGTKLTHNLDLIKKHHIEKILELLRSLYDFVFIAVSNKVTSGTVYGLFEADEIVLVAKNNYSNYREINKTLKLISNYKNDKSNIHLVVNQYTEISEVNFSEFVKDNIIKEIELVPYNEATFDNSNIEKNIIQSMSFFNKKKDSDRLEDLTKLCIAENNN